MPNSQEQSLDEGVVFLEVSEASPEFLYCETQRQALERLLNAGPEAFYGSIGTERSGCFLSPEEVRQITGWTQDYRFSQLQREDTEVDGADAADLCSTYFPGPSDAPAPVLDLGWPEKAPWTTGGGASVHTNPPAEGEPHIREIIRRHLQTASQVIAIVTDRLTDGAIIGDLHDAASRSVPVYVILNQRSIHENFTLNRLRHPNMRVRCLGGKSFCSRTGRMVAGEMKDRFLLVDVETVIHGSYSLTWTDAHLHRQLITVLRGPVVEAFDREFRILFAASLPVADTLRAAGSHEDVKRRLKDLSELRLQKRLPAESEMISPPSPPPDSHLDWEAMGVVQRESIPESPLRSHDETVLKETPLTLWFDDNNPPHNNMHHLLDRNMVFEPTFPESKHVPEKSAFNNTRVTSSTDLTPERMRRVDRMVEKHFSRQLSAEKTTNNKTLEQKHNKVTTPPTNGREQPSRKEVRVMEETVGRVENAPSSRKPIILKMPQSDSPSSLSDIMKKLQPQLSPSRPLNKGPNVAVSELSQSLVDLSVHRADLNPEDRDVPAPRLRASCYDPGYMTPAFALMKKRNDDLKSALYRSPTNFLPRDRPRTSTLGLNMDWRRSLAERELE